MIISTANDKLKTDFGRLMNKTDVLLNKKAASDSAYFKNKGGKKLEVEVYKALMYCADGTDFANTIELVSGASFPDIIANKYFGVEVKSTEKNKWCSIGSSILESTRNEDVERIYMTFGKLGAPIQFKSKPYEECLSDIVVTHYPRYRIDMEIQEKGKRTIFEKMGVEYEELRKMENPVPVVSGYYKKRLKPGESLWWSADNIEEATVAPTVRLWSTLDSKEQDKLRAIGCVLFPEIVSSNSPSKYQRFALWLATEQGVIHTNVRDTFSAGGRFRGVYKDGEEFDLPQVYNKLYELRYYISMLTQKMDESLLKNGWNTDTLEENRTEQWIRIILGYVGADDKPEVSRFLRSTF